MVLEVVRARDVLCDGLSLHEGSAELVVERRGKRQRRRGRERKESRSDLWCGSLDLPSLSVMVEL